MGVREDIDWEFIPSEKKHNITVADVIDNLGPDDIPEIDHVHIYKPMIKNSITGERFTLKEVFDAYKRDNRIFYTAKDGTQKIRIGKKIMRSDWSYIITGGGMLMHWSKMYPLTIRERARIQGFPDEFSFKGLPETAKAKAVGKSMPLQFTEHLVKVLEGSEDIQYSKIIATPFVLKAKSDF
jgi:site-specific DNA-cytosine methylase